MSDIARLHREALDATGRTVAGISADQLAAPTPCAGWDVRALLNHLVSGNWWAAELANGRTIDEVGSKLDGDQLGSDFSDAYQRSAAAAAAAFEAPGALEAPCAVSYGPVPGSVYAGHRFIDVLIHGWDLAAATGQNTNLDSALVADCLAEVEPQAAMFRASGMFGDDVAAAPDATAQTRLLALLGRRG